MLGDLTGALGDLGVMVPLAVSLVLVNHLDPAGVFVGAGLLVVAAGLVFRVPFPVQPLKALAAVAVAQRIGPGVIHAAGLEVGAFLLLVSVGDIAGRIARIFTKPVVRALQLGVGVLLVRTAVRLALHPPAVFRGTPPSPWPPLLALASLAVVWWAARTRRYALAIVLLAGGIGLAWARAAPALAAPSFALPHLVLPRGGDLATAFVLLVIPQLPLTFGNAVVAVTDVARGSFGPASERVTPSRVCISCGIGNLLAALIGGMPMCHGAGGLTAHVRLGARTMRMNLFLGSAFLVLGLFFAGRFAEIVGLLPIWVLAAFLAYAGLRHALLVADQRGADLAVACATGALGAVCGNLAITVAAALACELARRTAAARARPDGIARIA